MNLDDLTLKPTRVLLIHTHAIDIRLPWYRWHQPTGLLQIGAALKKRGCDVRLIDCLGWEARGRARRRKVGSVEVEGYQINLWRFGGLWGHLMEQVWDFKREGWTPDQVYISCSMTAWWQAAREVIVRVKQDWFPDAQVILGGVYPTLEPEHAKLHTNADLIVEGFIPEARDEIPDLTLYPSERRPIFAGVYLYKSQGVLDVKREKSVAPRSPEDIAQEIADKAALGVTEFAFFDDMILERDHFRDVLKAIAGRNLGVRFVATGNVSPSFIDGEIARLMGDAGYKQVYLQCDVTHQPDSVIYGTPYDAYQACVDALRREAGFKHRTDDITAMLLVGSPHEDIEAATERLIRLASVVGAVNLVQYQYSSRTPIGEMYAGLIDRGNGNLNLTQLNCKLYPLARLSGTPFEHYVELTRLAALLNSKYRSKTFDFLGSGIVAQAVQNSLRSEGWDPFNQVPIDDYAEVIPLTLVTKGGQHDR